MNQWNQPAFLKALGWSLLDSLWQMGILWLIYVLLTANGNKYSSKFRHTLALLLLSAGTLWFISDLSIHFYKADNPLGVSTANEVVSSASSFSQLPGLLEVALPYLSVMYLLAIPFLFVRFYRQYCFTQKLTTSHLSKINPELRVFLRQTALRMGISKDVQVWLSDMVDTPLTLGFWKPMILLPVAVINHLSLQQTEAVLLHELNHIRRNDYLLNLLIACVDIILFFNPFSRLLTDILKKERENSCDDLVLQFRYDAHLYAKALLSLEQYRYSPTYLAVAATGKNKDILLNRVKRILNQPAVVSPVQYKPIAYLVSVAMIAFIGWYNPGKIIANKIIVAEAKPVTMRPEVPMVFVTPAPPKNKLVIKSALVKQAAIFQEDHRSFRRAELEMELEKLLSQTSAEAVKLVEDNGSASPVVTAFAASPTARDFSISEKEPITVPYEEFNSLPYVPGNSFSYQLVEDTSLPKKYLLTVTDQKARESMEKALKALQEIDWRKMEEELNKSGKKVDIVKLRHEMKKALAEVNWEKVNEDFESSLLQAQQESLKDHETLRQGLEKFQKDKLVQMEKTHKVQLNIVQDRLKECKSIQKLNSEKKNQEQTIQKKKKIVVI